MKSNEWLWASHRPMIQMVLEVYKPKVILELGCGLYSTPLFQNCCSKYKGIENDKAWAEKIRSVKGIDVDFHDLKGITINKQWKELTDGQKGLLTNYYKELGAGAFVNQNRGPKLLFVDGFVATRRIAIDVLKDKFDLVIFHDSHPWQDCFNYNHGKEEGFVRYNLTSKGNWTSLLVKDYRDKGLKVLRDTIKPHVKDFNTQWGGEYNFNLELL